MRKIVGSLILWKDEAFYPFLWRALSSSAKNMIYSGDSFVVVDKFKPATYGESFYTILIHGRFSFIKEEVLMVEQHSFEIIE